MSKLSERLVQPKKYLLGDVEINVKTIPFGKLMEYRREFDKVQNMENLKAEEQDVLLNFIKQVLIEFTDLEEGDIGGADYSLSLEEVQGLFSFITKESTNPKGSGPAET